MDLSRAYPRSPKEEMAGLVHLARMIDKAQAFKQGQMADYIYPSPLDKIILNFLRIDSDVFAAKAMESSDEEIRAWAEEMVKDKKTEAHLDSLMLSLTKNKITKSVRKETEFKLGALFVYLLMIKVNKKKGDNSIKKKLSKKNICIYMAEQIKEFRMLYLYYKKNKYPRMEKRKEIPHNE